MGLDRVAAAFAKCREGRRAAFVPFVTAGDPDPGSTPSLLEGLAAGGADLVEVGIPFSDPLADGPVLQRSQARALAAGTTVDKALAAVAAARAKVAAPVLAMVSASLVLARGAAKFAADSTATGLDGWIVPDAPLEESGPIRDAALAAGLAWVPLVAPTTPADRRRAIAGTARGFLYYVSVAGVTGARESLPADVAAAVAALREVSPVPVCVGFGVSTPPQAETVARAADGVIVGSALVAALEEALADGPAEAVRQALAKARLLSAAVRRARTKS